MSDIDVEIFNTDNEIFINNNNETDIEIVDNSIEIEISGLKTLKRFIGLEDTPLYYEDGKFFKVEGNKIVYADIQWKDITGDMSENEALLEEVKELVQDASLEFVNTEIQKHNEDVFAHSDIRQSVVDVSDTLNSKIDSNTNNLEQQISSLSGEIKTNKNDIIDLKQKDDTLQEQIDNINSSIGTDIANKLHLLQQEVDENYIELNSNKVDKETGKGLSSNDLTDDLLNQIEANTLNRHNHDNKDILDLINAPFTREDKTKLDNIEDGAQVNTVTSVNGQIGDVYIPQLEQIQSDWKSVNPESKAYILNKPTKLSDFENDVEYITKDVDNLTNYTQTGIINNLLFKKVDKEVGKGLSTNDFTNELLQKLESIEEGAEKNIVTSVNGKIGDVYLHFFSLDDDQIITGQNTFLNDVTIGNLENPQNLNLTGNSNILGDLNIEGNIIQNGEQYETHAQKVYSTNDYITLRDGAVSGLIPGNYSGLEFKLYDGINDGRLVIDNSGTARVGDIGDEQPLLTRDEITSLTDKGVLIWDAENYKAKTSTEYSKTEEFAPVAFSAEYGDLKNVPTKLSDFTDDTDTNPIKKAVTLKDLTVTSNTLNLLSGTTSNIQEQLDQLDKDLDTAQENLSKEISDTKTEIENTIQPKLDELEQEIDDTKTEIKNIIQPKLDELDQEIDTKVNLDDMVEVDIDGIKSDIINLENTKQDNLTSANAGDGISIVDGIISSTHVSVEWGNIQGDILTQTDLADNYQGVYTATINLTDTTKYLDTTWYPVVGESLYIKRKNLSRGVLTRLTGNFNLGGIKPSWSTHASGFTCVLDLLDVGYAWGGTPRVSHVLQDSTNFTTDNTKPPIRYSQMTNSSRPVFWLRGGGKYYLTTEYDAKWSIKTSSYTNSEQTVTPTTTCPALSLGTQLYVKKAGDTMAGALNFANGVWNKVGDDAYIGDYNIGAHVCIKTASGVKTNEAGLAFYNSANTQMARLTANANTIMSTNALSVSSDKVRMTYNATNECLDFTFN